MRRCIPFLLCLLLTAASLQAGFFSDLKNVAVDNKAMFTIGFSIGLSISLYRALKYPERDVYTSTEVESTIGRAQPMRVAQPLERARGRLRS